VIEIPAPAYHVLGLTYRKGDPRNNAIRAFSGFELRGPFTVLSSVEQAVREDCERA
jgi:hypothetical protein